jgi:heterodisulfide reductase subunit C
MIALVIRANYELEENLSQYKASEICLKCGVCCVIRDYSCHAQFDLQFDPKYTFVYDCLISKEPKKNPNIWLCVSCHKCEEVCPYEVSPISFIESIKAQAFRAGFAHPVILGEIENVASTGYAFTLTTRSKRQRDKLDLEPLDISGLEEIKMIFKWTGLAERLKRYMED